jgi:hypothetical protein
VDLTISAPVLALAQDLTILALALALAQDLTILALALALAQDLTILALALAQDLTTLALALAQSTTLPPALAQSTTLPPALAPAVDSTTLALALTVHRWICSLRVIQIWRRTEHSYFLMDFLRRVEIRFMRHFRDLINLALDLDLMRDLINLDPAQALMISAPVPMASLDLDPMASLDPDPMASLDPDPMASLDPDL